MLASRVPELDEEEIEYYKKLEEKQISENRKDIVAPSDESFVAKQISLFQEFYDDDDDHLSNTIELWDTMPKYSISQNAMNRMRTTDGLLPRLERHFVHRKREFTIKITAAFVENDDGEDIAYYPSSNEELTENALRKLATEQLVGFYDKNNYRSGLLFSLTMLKNELKKRGHSRSYQQIIKSLYILAGANIEILAADGSSVAKANYLQSLVGVSRSQLKHDRKARWIVNFHPLVTKSINLLAYRQYNYDLMMSYRLQLARWFHVRLSNNYTNASRLRPYHMMLTTIIGDSGMLDELGKKRGMREQHAYVLRVLNELVERKTILSYSYEVRHGARNKITDVKYELIPTQAFVLEIIAANKRNKEHRARLAAESPAAVGAGVRP